LWKHTFHSGCFLGMVEPKEVGFTQTQRITWREKHKVKLDINLILTMTELEFI